VPVAKAGGQRRHDLRIGRQPGYVDPERSAANRVLIEPPPPGELRRRTEMRRSWMVPRPRRRLRSDSAVALTGIITFGRNAQPLISAATPERQDAAYRAVAEALAAHCGAGLLGLVVHADESAPHAHFWLDARDRVGASVARAVKGSELQDIAAAAIRPHFPEITRGVSKRLRMEAGEPRAAFVHRSVRQLHRDLPAEIAAAEAGLEVKRAQAAEVETRLEPLRRKEAQLTARITKLERRLDDGLELTVREEKRLATYGRRLEKTLAAQKQAAAVLAGIRAEIEALEERRMPVGNLLTGGLRRREQGLLEREDRIAAASAEIKAGREAADAEIKAMHEAAAADAEQLRRNTQRATEKDLGRTLAAAALIVGEIATPNPEPGSWIKGNRYSDERKRNWEKEYRLDWGLWTTPWPAKLWAALRDFAERITAEVTAEVRQLRKDLAAAIEASQRLREELSLRPTLKQHAELAGRYDALKAENSRQAERIRELEPPDPEPAPDPSPSYGPSF